jgi:hypothetical protein
MFTRRTPEPTLECPHRCLYVAVSDEAPNICDFTDVQYESLVSSTARRRTPNSDEEAESNLVVLYQCHMAQLHWRSFNTCAVRV